jgi:hypothetical protein
MAQCDVCGNDYDKAFSMLLTNIPSAMNSALGSVGGPKR